MHEQLGKVLIDFAEIAKLWRQTERQNRTIRMAATCLMAVGLLISGFGTATAQPETPLSHQLQRVAQPPIWRRSTRSTSRPDTSLRHQPRSHLRLSRKSSQRALADTSRPWTTRASKGARRRCMAGGSIGLAHAPARRRPLSTSKLTGVISLAVGGSRSSHLIPVRPGQVQVSERTLGGLVRPRPKLSDGGVRSTSTWTGMSTRRA